MPEFPLPPLCQRCALVILVVLNFLVRPLCAQETESPQAASATPAVTSLQEYWSLSTEARQYPVPFRLECDVTYYDPDWGQLWVQDATTTAYVIAGPRPLPIQSGQRILVTGINSAGPDLSFADASFQILGPATTAPLSLDNRMTNVDQFRGRLVTLDGMVDRRSQEATGHHQYQISVEGQRGYFWVRLAAGEAPPDLADTHVRITGLYNPSLDAAGEFAVLYVMVPDTAHIQILSRLENDPRFNLPRTPIDRLPECPVNTLVRIEGVTVGHTPGTSLQLRDDTGQIDLRSAQTIPCANGDRVEAIGFPRVVGTTWQLANAVYRPTARPGPGPTAPLPDRPLRLTAQVRELSPSAISAGRPARLSGVVTWAHQSAPFFFIQDASGGLCVFRDHTKSQFRPPGRRVEIRGVTIMGPFAPAVDASDIVKVGDTILPTARPISLEHALTGAAEAQLVEMQGYVRQIHREGLWTRLEIATATGDFDAMIAATEPLEGVVDSVVRLRGVCAARANSQRQFQSIGLWLSDASAVQITEPARADSFDRPLHAIATLGRFGSVPTFENRIKVRGTVTHHTPGVALHILEDGAPLLVLSRDPVPLTLGDQIEAVGFSGRQGQRLALREAHVRKIGTAVLPPAQQLANPEQLRPASIGQLVQLDGQLIATATTGDKLRLTIQYGNSLFEAYLRAATANHVATVDWPVGSLLSLTGVYDLQYDAYGRPALLQLHVQDGAGVVLLQRPPWLDRGRILTIATVLAIGILLVALWGTALRLRVRRQTDQIRRQLERESHLEAELQRTSKLEAIGLLAGGIAHDFNNLLTVVMGNLSLVGLDPGLEKDSVSCLQEAEKAVGRSRDLTLQLLTFAKGGDPIRSAVALADIVQESARFALHGSTVRAEFELATGLWPAEVDRGQIGQVVQNIVINAVQAMPQGGRIRISIANETVPDGDRLLAAGRYLRLNLADNGPGIAADVLPRIFDPYFTTKKTGHGIGLATVHSIIKKHQGHITASSVLGQGCLFKIWLPAATSVVPHSSLHGATAPIQQQRGRALVLDDEEGIRRLASAMLERLGLEAIAVADGTEAIRAYAQGRQEGRPFDLVILDLTIPGGLGGEETMRQLLQLDPDVCAIVSSGYSNNPVLADHRRFGFKGMVSKPYELADLSLVVDQLLAAPK